MTSMLTHIAQGKEQQMRHWFQNTLDTIPIAYANDCRWMHKFMKYFFHCLSSTLDRKYLLSSKSWFYDEKPVKPLYGY